MAKFLVRVLKSAALPAGIFIVLFIFASERVGWNSLMALLQQAMLPSLLGFGLIFAFNSGIWDFSPGAVVIFGGVIGGHLVIRWGLGLEFLLLFCVIIGLAVGIINGLLYKLFKVPSIIITIGMMLILESLSVSIISGNVSLPVGTAVATTFPYNLIVFGVFAVFVYILFNYRRFGYQVRAVGNNADIAQINGINIMAIRMKAFVMVGLAAGLYAYMNLGGNGAVNGVANMASMSIVFDGLMCAIIAMSLSKATNMVIGVYIGGLTMQMVKLGMLALRLPSILQQVIIAVFILVFLAITTEKDFKIRIRKPGVSKAS